MDNKYGNLYTEDDVKLIVQCCVQNQVYNDDQLMEAIESMRAGDELKFMSGEPLFVLRGKDRLALAAVRCYLERCEGSQHVPAAHIDSVVTACHAFEGFRADYPEVLDFPD